MSRVRNPKPQTIVNARMSVEMADKFKKLAKERNRNPSILIRDWVMAYIKEHDKEDNE